MAPVAAIVANARNCALQQTRLPRELDLATGPACLATEVRRARPEEVRQLMQLAQVLIGGQLAAEYVVRRVVARHPDSLWTFVRDHRLIGGLAMLILNASGLEALLTGAFDAFDPDVEFLATPVEAPAAIYLWGFAQLSGSEGVLSVFSRLQSAPYGSANIYAVPVTANGLRFLTSWGFRSIPGHRRELHEYVRLTNRLH
jgi:hypothetical protein